MKLEFFQRPAEERAEVFKQTAARRGVGPIMVEKDFWVSWTLGALFAHPNFCDQLVFKGGTSLSKVFDVIHRFSEDIDLSVSPRFLGINEDQVENLASRNKRTEQMQQLEAACAERVGRDFLPELEKMAVAALGEPNQGAQWMEFLRDETTQSPVVLFNYPSFEVKGFEYLKRSVKIEFGSLTDQKPVGTHQIRPWAADEFPKIFPDFQCKLCSLELERTFWEKATILHAEYHRDPEKPIRDHFSRHYSDMASLARSKFADAAIARQDLRERVASWKSRFFPATWARYDLAKPGTFRLVPREARLTELQKDYEAMRDMFIGEPVPLREIMETVAELEAAINRGKAGASRS